MTNTESGDRQIRAQAQRQRVDERGKTILRCEWCGEEFEHGYAGTHISDRHREKHLRIREVVALENIAVTLDWIYRSCIAVAKLK